MDVAAGIHGAVVVGEFSVGDAHLAEDALERIDRTSGDGDHGDVALGVIGGHVQDETGERVCRNSLIGELAAPLAGLDDHGIACVDRNVGQGEGTVDGGEGGTDEIRIGVWSLWR